MVSRYRKELEADCAISTVDARTGRDGRTMQEAKALKRRKQIYEALHPETKPVTERGGPGRGNKRATECRSFSDDTATKTGKSSRTIRRAVEIGENLQHLNLTALEESQSLARRKEIYEALHPETKQGAKGGPGNVKTKKNETDNMAVSFSDDTATKTGKSSRTIRRAVEIGENLQHLNLTALEESQSLARRKEIYEALHPETKAGGDRGNQHTGGKTTKCRSATFTDDTSTKTGKSRRTVERAVEIGENLSDEAAEVYAVKPLWIGDDQDAERDLLATAKAAGFFVLGM